MVECARKVMLLYRGYISGLVVAWFEAKHQRRKAYCHVSNGLLPCFKGVKTNYMLLLVMVMATSYTSALGHQLLQSPVCMVDFYCASLGSSSFGKKRHHPISSVGAMLRLDVRANDPIAAG